MLRHAGSGSRGHAAAVACPRRRWVSWAVGKLAVPGAANALATLAGLSSKDVIQSVLTGNTRPSAEIKLRTFGLDTWLDLDIGAYGTDDDTRANLVPIARQRATDRTGYEFGRETTVLIGDTPADITAARDGSARIIAVATGQHSAADLADADTVLADLTSSPALMAALYPREPPQ